MERETWERGSEGWRETWEGDSEGWRERLEKVAMRDRGRDLGRETVRDGGRGLRRGQ